jgi:hypothetical protein
LTPLAAACRWVPPPSHGAHPPRPAHFSLADGVGSFFVWPSLTYLVYVSWFGVVVEPKAAAVGAYMMDGWFRRLLGCQLLPLGRRGQEWLGLVGASRCLLLIFLCCFATHATRSLVQGCEFSLLVQQLSTWFWCPKVWTFILFW